MFSNWFLKSFRILLLPFAILFGFIIWVRNWMYDRNIIRSATFGLPVICIGNLSVGGTGKTPMVEYLIKNLKAYFRLAVLSRGYKRKTTGYALANEKTTALEIGDEPMQFHRKFPTIPVAVGEQRIEAIPQLLHDKPDTQLIILDDAFQHRAIRAGLNILLTEKDNLFTHDFYLPTGDLRDLKSSYKRADIIVVTKCNFKLSAAEKADIIAAIQPMPHQQVFFTGISYGIPQHIINENNFKVIDEQTDILLIAGIANPKPLKQYLEERIRSYYMLDYSDHHVFSTDDWRDIRKKFEEIESDNKILLTTEKDAMRLLKYEQELVQLPMYVLPIEHRFLFNEGEAFNNLVINFIQNFKQPVSN